MKNTFNQMSTDFRAHDDLISCINKIIEGTTILFGVYERIDSYKSQMATLNTKVTGKQNSFEFIVNDVNLQETVQKLDQKIHVNLVLERYETAMTTLRQHTFPFASNYFEIYDLPGNITATENEAIQIMTQKITDIVDKLKQKDTVIDKFSSI